MNLYSTSCSSDSFCVAAGYVEDGGGYSWALAEVYAGGVWTPSVLPVPADACTPAEHCGPSAALASVSCPVDGVCAAVGTYEAWDPSTKDMYQTGLLEVLSASVWTPSESELPDGPDSGNVNLNSVSCPNPQQCVAVGGTYNRDDTWSGVIYAMESPGEWQMQVAPLTPDAGKGEGINAISCPASGSCVAVGTYGDSTYNNRRSVILTLSGGTWMASTSPEPPDAASETLENDGQGLLSIDCPEVDYCVAGGDYFNTSQDIEPVLVEFQSGSWAASTAPVPSDAGADPVSQIDAVYCPTENNCLAAGDYFIDWATGTESGMLLTQSNGAWSAVPGPILSGIGCGESGFCAAAGADSSDGLLYTTSLSDLPSVTTVSPSQGPIAGGTSVTVTGANFGPGSTLSFGSISVPTTFVSSTELQAVTPAANQPSNVDVTVSSGGAVSRANFEDIFTYGDPNPPEYGFEILNSALPAATVGQRYSVHLHATGGLKPYRWSILSGQLPRGLHLSYGGVISGVTDTERQHTFVVKVVHSQRPKDRRNLAAIQLTLAVSS